MDPNQSEDVKSELQHRVPDSIEKALASVEQALENVREALGTVGQDAPEVIPDGDQPEGPTSSNVEDVNGNEATNFTNESETLEYQEPGTLKDKTIDETNVGIEENENPETNVQEDEEDKQYIEETQEEEVSKSEQENQHQEELTPSTSENEKETEHHETTAGEDQPQENTTVPDIEESKNIDDKNSLEQDTEPKAEATTESSDQVESTAENLESAATNNNPEENIELKGEVINEIEQLQDATNQISEHQDETKSEIFHDEIEETTKPVEEDVVEDKVEANIKSDQTVMLETDNETIIQNCEKIEEEVVTTIEESNSAESEKEPEEEKEIQETETQNAEPSEEVEYLQVLESNQILNNIENDEISEKKDLDHSIDSKEEALPEVKEAENSDVSESQKQESVPTIEIVEASSDEVKIEATEASAEKESGAPIAQDEVEPTNTEKDETEPAESKPTDTGSAETESVKIELAETESTETEQAVTEQAETEHAEKEQAETEHAKTEPAESETVGSENAKTVPADVEVSTTTNLSIEENQIQISPIDVVVSETQESLEVKPATGNEVSEVLNNDLVQVEGKKVDNEAKECNHTEYNPDCEYCVKLRSAIEDSKKDQVENPPDEINTSSEEILTGNRDPTIELATINGESPVLVNVQSTTPMEEIQSTPKDNEETVGQENGISVDVTLNDTHEDANEAKTPELIINTEVEAGATEEAVKTTDEDSKTESHIPTLKTTESENCSKVEEESRPILEALDVAFKTPDESAKPQDIETPKTTEEDNHNDSSDFKPEEFTKNLSDLVGTLEEEKQEIISVQKQLFNVATENGESNGTEMKETLYKEAAKRQAKLDFLKAQNGSYTPTLNAANGKQESETTTQSNTPKVEESSSQANGESQKELRSTSQPETNGTASKQDEKKPEYSNGASNVTETPALNHQKRENLNTVPTCDTNVPSDGKDKGKCVIS